MGIIKHSQVNKSPDLSRILALPRRVWSDSEAEKLAKVMTAKLKRPGGTMALKPVQAVALYEIQKYGGLVGHLRVGSGKTLVSLLAPSVLGVHNYALIVPAALREKTNRERVKYSQHWILPPTFRIWSYEELGRVQGANILTTFKPEFLIFDEAHKAKNLKAGVVRRLRRYMQDFPATRCVVMSGTLLRNSIEDFGHLSDWALKEGSPLPRDIGVLKEWAEALEDPDSFLSVMHPGSLMALPGGEDGSDERQQVRQKVQKRMLETGGVVGSRGEQVSASLYLRPVHYKTNTHTENNFKQLRNLWETPDGYGISEAVIIWKTARELALGFHYVTVSREKYAAWIRKRRTEGKENIAKTLSELKNSKPKQESIKQSSGKIQNSELKRLIGTDVKNTDWVPTNLEQSGKVKTGNVLFAGKTLSAEQKQPTSTIVTRRGLSGESYVTAAIPVLGDLETLSSCSKEEFATFLETARPPDDWKNARRDWAKFVRDTLADSKTLDTEKQVALACERGELDSTCYKAWKNIEKTFDPGNLAVWHDDSALKVCEEWAKSTDNGIIWAEHRFFAKELAKRTGLPYFGLGGVNEQKEPIDHPDTMAKHPIIIASISSNATGRNLQRYSNNLVVSVPTNGMTWEQLLGRSHRDGQEADTVSVEVFLGCREHYAAIPEAIRQAAAIKDTVGEEQKLLLCDVDWPLTSPRGYAFAGNVSKKELAALAAGIWEDESEEP